MFLDWENQYCLNDHTTQGNLQIQRNPYQDTKGIFNRTGTNNFKICMETQKMRNSQNYLEKEQSWRAESCSLTSDYTTSSSNQSSMVMAQK